MKPTGEQLVQMQDDIFKASGYVIDIDDAAFVIHTYDVWCMPPRGETAKETAELVYLQRKYRNQQWTPAWKPIPNDH